MSARKPAADAAETDTPTPPEAAAEPKLVELRFTACYWPIGPVFVENEDEELVELAPEGVSAERRCREGNSYHLTADEALDVIEKGVAKRVKRG